MPEPGEVSNGYVWTGSTWVRLQTPPASPAPGSPAAGPPPPTVPPTAAGSGKSAAPRWLWPVVALAAVVIIAATVITVVLLTRSSSTDTSPPTPAEVSAARSLLDSAKVLDTAKLETQIAAELSTRIGDDITVDCPADQPVRAGYTFECVASDSTGTKRVVVVTEDDDQGNVTWELTDREP